MPCGIVNNNNLIEKYFNAEKTIIWRKMKLKLKKIVQYMEIKRISRTNYDRNGTCLYVYFI